MTVKIAIIGLGYVGLPLCLSLAKHFEVVGFDIDQQRILSLKQFIDENKQVSQKDLKISQLSFFHEVHKISDSNFFIITVQTPVNQQNRPDLSAIENACQLIGNILKYGDIVVLESTVYPGVTENFCGTVLERISGLVSGKDFYLGYSPERINIGDDKNRLSNTTKIVSGQDHIIADKLAKVYGKINNNNIFIASSIKVAEAAKLLENMQRDINIALINEVAIVLQEIDVSIYEVIAAAETKWNFFKFIPGFVSGHCIGVDSYYFIELANQTNCPDSLITTARRINENMSLYIAAMISNLLKGTNKHLLNILVLGITFKENVSDIRNSKVVDLVKQLSATGYHVDVHDPIANAQEVDKIYSIRLCELNIKKKEQCSSKLKNSIDSKSARNFKKYDCIVCAVSHAEYSKYSSEYINTLVEPNGIIMDIKGIWSERTWVESVKYVSL